MNQEALEDAFEKSVAKEVQGESRVAVAYSGGVDSSIIACFASRITKVHCYTCAVEGSFDSRDAAQAAALEGLEHSLISLTREGLVQLVREASRLLGGNDPVRVAYTIPILGVLRNCSENLVLTGSGADELFGGYAKYASVKDPSDMMLRDLKKLESEIEMLQREAVSAGKRIGFPFVAGDIVSIASQIPLDEKINSSGRKLVLRQVAKTLGLPSHERPKKAAQYSSGVMREMERQAKRDGKTTANWIESLMSA